MKKAIILTPSFLPKLNGMSYATIGHARMLSDIGLEVTIISNDCPDSESFKNYGLHNIECFKYPIYGSGLLWSPVRGPILEIIDKIKDIEPDYIFVEGWYNWGTYLLTILPNFYVKIVFSHGSGDYDMYNFTSFLRRLGYYIYDWFKMPRILKKVNGLILLSDYKDNKRFKDFEYVTKYSIKSIVIPNRHIEEVSGSELRYKLKSTTGFNIAIIGEMSHNKNQAYIIEKFNQLNKTINVHFFYPTDNKYSNQLHKNNSSLCERVMFHKGIDRIGINEFLKHNIDIILVLSRTEAQPIVVIDGIFNGIPFVSTNVGCISIFKGGIVCTIEDIVDNINLMCCNQKLMNHYKENTKIDRKFLQFDTQKLNTFLNNLNIKV